MREFLGADTSALLSVAEQYDFRLALEDPATLWDRGPERYVEIARQYRRLAPGPQRLVIDINIVERYQVTYPTKKQVGTELFQLVHLAGKAFPTVLLYFEQSISRPDWDLLPHASGQAQARTRGEFAPGRRGPPGWRGFEWSRARRRLAVAVYGRLDGLAPPGEAPNLPRR